MKLFAVALVVALCVPALRSQGPPAEASASSMVSQLPADRRAEGEALLADTVERTRARKADLLGRKDPAGTRSFLLAVLREERQPWFAGQSSIALLERPMRLC